MGEAEIEEIVVSPLPGFWVKGDSSSVSCTVSIRARPSWVILSPSRASDDANSPGPRTRTRVLDRELSIESVWLLTAARVGVPPVASATPVGAGFAARVMVGAGARFAARVGVGEGPGVVR